MPKPCFYYALMVSVGLWSGLAFAGSAVSDARIYDERGRLSKKIEGGRIESPQGHMQGRISPNGQVTDERGYFKGRVDQSGRVTDERGFFKGRLRDGVIYDKKGYFKGRVKNIDDK